MRNLDAHEDYKVDEQWLHRDIAQLPDDAKPRSASAPTSSR
ncbi:hypothetical protein [Oceanithermus sp.]|nr:hypothetical protein [Oceanithermus sp.]